MFNKFLNFDKFKIKDVLKHIHTEFAKCKNNTDFKNGFKNSMVLKVT
ncbi:Mlp family lipoprotein [Borrelia turicatae]|nr:Mlp family lipoprotein [Borrelia turicatae]